MPSWKNYLIPYSLEEAIILLDRVLKSSKIIAGGTDLLLGVHFGIGSINCLITNAIYDPVNFQIDHLPVDYELVRVELS